MGLGKVARWSGTSWLYYGRISCQGSTSLGLRGRGTRGKFLACLRLRRRLRSCLPAARSSRRCWASALRVTLRHGGGERQCADKSLGANPRSALSNMWQPCAWTHGEEGTAPTVEKALMLKPPPMKSTSCRTMPAWKRYKKRDVAASRFLATLLWM